MLASPTCWVACLPHNHMKSYSPRVSPHLGKPAACPALAPPGGWNTRQDQWSPAGLPVPPPCSNQGQAPSAQDPHPTPAAALPGPCPAAHVSSPVTPVEQCPEPASMLVAFSLDFHSGQFRNMLDNGQPFGWAGDPYIQVLSKSLLPMHLYPQQLGYLHGCCLLWGAQVGEAQRIKETGDKCHLTSFCNSK